MPYTTDKTSDPVWTIRALAVEDVPQIAALDQTVSANPWSTTDFINEFKQTCSVGFCAKNRIDRIGGFILARIVEDECDICTIAVAKEHQNQGLGTKLLNTLLTSLPAGKQYSLYLEVAETNLAARALYKKFGFIESYTRKKYYTNTGDNALILSLSLPKQHASL